jgi:hypothetical protein
MLLVTGLSVPLEDVDGTYASEERALRRAVLKRLHVQPDDLLALEPVKRSIDARKKGVVHLQFSCHVQLRGGERAERVCLEKLARRKRDRGVTLAAEKHVAIPHLQAHPRVTHPVVVGAGCAGLFCALALAHAGCQPILVERGRDATRRGQDVARFNETGILDPESNIQFGLGGAGTFSDGKLATGTKSDLHRLVLETFVAAGAEPEILVDAKPHVGSDVLPAVVTHVMDRIRELGGEVRLETRAADLLVENGAVTGVVVEHAGVFETIPADTVVLACGHSARDTLEVLGARGVALERKTFAMGVRIEHLQKDVDACQYGALAGHPALGAAPYKLVARTSTGRSIFSFCMCPGGYVVAAASEPGGVVTNGMSLSDRAGRNANSGLLVNVEPADLPGDDPLEGIRLQRACEQAAFEAGGGAFRAPAQLVGDFLNLAPSTGPSRVLPTYPRGVKWTALDGLLPAYMTDTMRAGLPELAKKLACFSDPDAVLTGVETRSSSPVRVTRGPGFESVAVRGLYPIGEGAGYAGGIMSAATDGLRCAFSLVGEKPAR